MPHYFSFRIMFEFCFQPFCIHLNIGFLLVLEEISICMLLGLFFYIMIEILFRNLKFSPSIV